MTTSKPDPVLAVAVPDRGRLGGYVPCGPGTIYLLAFDDPADPHVARPGGWTLAAHQGGAGCWSAPLAGHGAGADVGLDEAQDRAGRLLAQHGIRVAQWHRGADARTIRDRAEGRATR